MYVWEGVGVYVGCWGIATCEGWNCGHRTATREDVQGVGQIPRPIQGVGTGLSRRDVCVGGLELVDMVYLSSA